MKKRTGVMIRGMLAISLISGIFLKYYNIREKIPEELYVFSDETLELEKMYPNSHLKWQETITASQSGSYRMECRIFGVLPLKEVKVIPVEQKTVYASGTPVGIYMETTGILIVNYGEIKDVHGIHHSPVKEQLQPGDYIIEVNGEKIERKKQFMELVQKNKDEEMNIEILRNNERIPVTVKPMETEEGDYKLGIWIRDNVQGIGTLTYIDENGKYAALGHGISDMDTGEHLDISKGDLYQANIMSVQKGLSGSPGELHGIIDYKEQQKLGDISKNTKNGIQGNLDLKSFSVLHCEKYPIGLKQELKEGKATMLCDVGEGVHSYEIEIEKIYWNVKDTNKSFKLCIRDEKLLEKTGGIVQGMSGSPILQNGKIVGAVTHVLVNDPTRGYGIFIENMLEAAE